MRICLALAYDYDGHIDNVLVQRRGGLTKAVTYRSWWIRYGNTPPVALAGDDDSEYDIGAYLAFMWQTNQRREYLLKKYSG